MDRRACIAVAALTAAAAGLAAGRGPPPRSRASRSRRARGSSPSRRRWAAGHAGAGGNVVIPFTVADIGGRDADVEVQYAWDRNADGLLSDDEFRPATEDRLDARDTRRNRAPQLYRTGRTSARERVRLEVPRRRRHDAAPDDRVRDHSPGRYVPDRTTPARSCSRAVRTAAS